MAIVEETKNHLNHILAEVAKQQNIENYETNFNIEALIGDGFVSQFYEGHIRNKDTGKIVDVAIKKAPAWEFEYQSLFFNEVLFYGKSYPALDELQKVAEVSKPFDNIPKYFCGDLEAKKEYLAMENLKKLGYVMFDKTQFMDKQHLETIFKIYGKFHALSFVLKNKNFETYKSITKDYTNISQKMIDRASGPMIASMRAAVNALDPDKDKTVYEELHDFGNRTMDLFLQVNEYKGKHSCLVHGDCWSNNMLFKYSDSGELLNVKLIDFQLSRDHTPINDLSYFFYSGASKKELDKLDEYLQVYHTSFSEFAKELGSDPDELFPLEALKTEWKEYGLYGIIVGIYLWQVKLTPKESFTDVMKENGGEKRSVEETFEMMERVLRNIHRSDLYRERTSDILRHAFEFGILNKRRILENKE